jgi:hypothetical protein
MENKRINAGTIFRNAFLLSVGGVWCTFLFFVIGSDAPRANCAGKTETECKALQKTLDEDHKRNLNTLFLNMG